MLSATLDKIILPVPIFRDDEAGISIDRTLQLISIYDFLGFKSFMFFGRTYPTDDLTDGDRATLVREVSARFPAATVHLIGARPQLDLAMAHARLVPYLMPGQPGTAADYLGELDRVLIDCPACRAYLHPRDFSNPEDFKAAAREAVDRTAAKISKHYEQPEDLQSHFWQRPERFVVGTDHKILDSIARQAQGIVSPVLSGAPHLASECGDIVSLETAITRLRESLGSGASKQARLYAAARSLGEATSAPRRNLNSGLSPYPRGNEPVRSGHACIEHIDRDFPALDLSGRTLTDDYIFIRCSFSGIRLDALNLGGKKLVFQHCTFNGPVWLRDLRGNGHIELEDCEFAERVSVYNANLSGCAVVARKCRVHHPLQGADCNLDDILISSCFVDGIHLASSSFKTRFALENGSIVRGNLVCDLAQDADFRMNDAECEGRLCVFLAGGGTLSIEDARAGEILIGGKPGGLPAEIESLELTKVEVDSDLVLSGVHYQKEMIASDVAIRGSLHFRGVIGDLSSRLALTGLSVRDSLVIETTDFGSVASMDVRFQAVSADTPSRIALEVRSRNSGIMPELEVLEMLKREATESNSHEREDRYAFRIEVLRARLDCQKRSNWLGKGLALIKNVLRRNILGYGLNPVSPLVSFFWVGVGIAAWNYLDPPGQPQSVAQAVGNVTSTLFFLEAIDNPTSDTHLTLAQVHTVVVARIAFFGIIGSSIIRKLIRR